MASTTSTAAESKKLLGNKAFGEGEYEKAIELYSEAIKLDDLNKVFYSNRAAAFLAVKKYEEARADCKKCLALDDGFRKGYLRLTLAELKLGNKADALNACKSGMKLFSNEEMGKNAKKSGYNDFKKLEREIKEQNRVADSKKQRLAVAGDHKRSDGTTQTADETAQELGRARISWQAKLQNTRAKAHSKAAEHHEKQLVSQAMGSLLEKKPEAISYRRMGKAYIKQKPQKILKDLKKEMTDLENEAKLLDKIEKKVVLELKEADRSFTEFQKAAIASKGV